MKLLIIVTCFFSIFPAVAWSGCKSETSSWGNYFIVKMSGFNPPEFDPNAVPIGGVIYSAKGQARISNKRGSNATVKCTSRWYAYLDGRVSHENGIYKTSIPNIGLRMSLNGKNLPLYTNTREPDYYWREPEEISLQVELIKTGNITAGGVLSGEFARYTQSFAAGPTLMTFEFASPVVVRPRIPTCKVATPLVNVPMGTVSSSSFKGVGTTTGQRTFAISLACSGGDAGTSTNAHVTLSDATMSGNASTTLSLTKDSTASGIGVQILKNDMLLGFGPDSAVVGNTNQWHAGTIAQGQTALTIPLGARYVQTREKVSPGSANARATFTLSYQ